MFVNYYEILGISPDASQAEIRGAYRKLALKFHPDKNEGDSFLMEMFKKINSANEVLSDDLKRTKYDQEYENFFKSSKSDSGRSNESWSNNQRKQNSPLNIRTEIEKAFKEYSFAKKKAASEQVNYDEIKRHEVTTYGDMIKVLWFVTLISFLFVVSNLRVTGGSTEFVKESPPNQELRPNSQKVKRSRNKSSNYSEKSAIDSATNLDTTGVRSEESSLSINSPIQEKTDPKKEVKGNFALTQYSINLVSSNKEYFFKSFIGKNPQKGNLFSKSFFNKKEIKNKVHQLLGDSNYKFFEDYTKTLGKSHDIKVVDNILLADSFVEFDNLHKIALLIDLNSGKFYIAMIQNNQSELQIFAETNPIPDGILNEIANYFNETNGALYNYAVEDGNIKITPL